MIESDSLVSLGLALVLAVAVPTAPRPRGPAVESTTSSVEQQRILEMPFPSEGRVVFNAHAAELHLEGWDREELRVEATKRVAGHDPSLDALAGDILERIVVRLEREGNRAELLVDYPPHCRQLRCSVTLQAYAPHRLAVSARYDDASLSVSGVHGGIEIENDSGDVSLRDVSGRIGVRTRGGNVNASPRVPTHISIVTGEGDIRVTLPRSGSAAPALLVRAPPGRVRSEAPLFSEREAYEAALRGERLHGGGWPRVELRSAAGSVVVELARD